MIEVGTKIIGNFGAMIPLWEGTVTGIIKSVNGVTIPATAVVEWDDLPMENIEFAKIKLAGSEGIGISIC